MVITADYVSHGFFNTDSHLRECGHGGPELSDVRPATCRPSYSGGRHVREQAAVVHGRCRRTMTDFMVGIHEMRGMMATDFLF